MRLGQNLLVLIKKKACKHRVTEFHFEKFLKMRVSNIYAVKCRKLKDLKVTIFLQEFCTYQCYPWRRGEVGGGGGAGGGGDFDILSKIFVKNRHSPGTTYFIKKHKNPHPRAGELCQMFLSRGNAIHSRHPPRPNQTKNLYVAKSTKNRNHSSNQLHEIK